MANDARQIGFTFQVSHDAAGHVHIAARQRKSIDLWTVQHREVPLQVGAVTLRRQLLPQRIHIALYSGVVVHAIVFQHLLMSFGAFSHLAGFIHYRALGLPCDGVDHRGAAASQQKRTE